MIPKSLLEDFSNLANAPNGVARLREIIYSLAIEGSLCEQIASEGTGAELLAAIADERENRISEGSFKRSPKLEKTAAKFSDSLPRIPRSWTWTRLVDIGEINARNNADDDCLASFAPMNAISELHNVPLRPEKRRWSSIKKGFTHFADGDVIVAKITPCFENGKGAVLRGLTNGIGAGTTELHLVRPLPGVMAEFIYIFLRSPHFKVIGEDYMTGTAGQKRLSTEYFAARPFPLPPLEEQKRIVAKVDELMRLCDRLESQQQAREKLLPILSRANHARFVVEPTRANLQAIFRRTGHVVPDDLRNTVLQLAVRGHLVPRRQSESDSSLLLSALAQEREKLADAKGIRLASPLPEVDPCSQPISVPDHWRWIRLGNLTSKIGSGSTPRGGSKVYVTEGVPFLRSQNIWNDGVRLDDVVFISAETHAKMRNTHVFPNDILLNITGASLGRCAKVPSDFPTANVSQHVTIIRPLLTETRHFLHICLLSPFGQAMIWGRQVGMAREGLSKKVLEQFEIPLPPLEEQKRITARVDELMRICDRLEVYIRLKHETAETLAKSIVMAITASKVTENERMKAPRTTVVTTLKTILKSKNIEEAPLAWLLADQNDQTSAKVLWKLSGLDIDAFYRQLKTEMANGWITEPEKAFVKEVEVS